MKTTHSPVNYCRPCDCCVCVTYTERGRSTLLPRNTRSSQNEILVTHVLKTIPSFQDVRTFSMLQPFQSKDQQQLWSCNTFLKKKKKNTTPGLLNQSMLLMGPIYSFTTIKAHIKIPVMAARRCLYAPCSPPHILQAYFLYVVFFNYCPHEIVTPGSRTNPIGI